MDGSTSRSMDMVFTGRRRRSGRVLSLPGLWVSASFRTAVLSFFVTFTHKECLAAYCP